MNAIYFSALIVGFLASSVFAAAEIEELCSKPGSQRGHIGVVNRQSLIPESEFKAAVDILQESRGYKFLFSRDNTAFKDACIRLEIVDDSSNVAPMTVSPEAGCGKLNVAALTNDLKTTLSLKQALPQRAKLEFLRLVCYAFGVGGSRFDDNLLSVTSLPELDSLEIFIPVDVFERMDKGGEIRGLRPEVVKPYREACQEGWAPAPTNAVQKAIWDEVHTPPKNPIKIEFDPKKGQ